MVSFTAMGRAGNFFFECATAWAYAKRHGLKFSVPKHTSHQYWSPIYLHHLVDPKYNPVDLITVEEKQFHYVPIQFDESWRGRNILLHGYFQSPKYFDEYRDEMLDAFNLAWESREGFVSVHIRRGDYLKLTMKHPPVSKEWYENAMSMFPGKKFIFFSDDIEYCKQTFGNRADCLFSEGKTVEQDLIDMSCCEHNIISASTFGWWGAYLNKNPNKTVVLPRQWFQPGWDNADTSDIVPDEWIKI